MVELEVGTPPVSHTLLFDTGSSTTWMVSADCDGTDSCINYSGYNRTGYDKSASSTAESLGTSASIDYMGGVTAGDGMQDVFSLPSAANTTTTWTQTFMDADESSWTITPADGFLGLAFSTISDANTTTMVETLLQGGYLDEPRFSLYYGTNTNDTGSGPGNGVLTYGGSHEDVYVDGNMTWAPLSAPGADAQLWRVNMQYLVGTKPGNNASSATTLPLSGDWGIFDTGAGSIYVPDPLVESIYESIGMNYTAILSHDHIPLCTEFTDEWYVDFAFGDAYVPTIVRLTGDMLKVPGFATGEDKYCWPPFQTSDSTGLFLFGGQFLEKFYTIFDFGGFEPENYNARFGFGALKEEYKPTNA